MTAARGSCFHCGEPIPAGIVLHARIADRDEPVCCHGCRAVAEFIAGAGLGDYYVYRDASAARADETPRPDRWAAYDRPELAERLSRGNADGTRSITVLLEGLRCAACSWLADKALRQQRGLREASVNPATARATLTWDPAEARLGDLLRVLEHVGLRPHPLAGDAAGQLALVERRTALKRLAVAGFGMMQVMMFAVPLYIGETSGMDAGIRELLRLVSMLVSVPVALYAGWPFYQGAWQSIRARSVSMDVPVSLGIVLAFVASVWNALTGRGEVYFDSVTMFVFFLALGRYVEMIARHRSGSVADALARLAPVTARRVRGAAVEDVPAAELEVGDQILVRTGEVFAADGTVVEGSGRVDESMLTGESTAVAKDAGAIVHAGTQNIGAPLRVDVSAVADRTVLAGIVALLERAQAERPRLARAADRAAAWFLGRILIGAALVFAAWWFVDPARAFPATLAVLVVTCPCALSLATPAAIAAATAALARRGVLVAHSDAFERLARADRMLWDKTGTLTRGLVRVEEVRTYGAEDEASCVALATAMERMSEHPIARAFVANGATARTATDVEVHAGLGVEGCVDGRRLRMGRPAWAAAFAGAAPPDGLAGESWVTLADEHRTIAAFRLTDPVRAEARDCVQALAALGLQSEIASGDDAAAVARVAARCGIESYSAGLTPDGKLARVRELQASGHGVVAVGDGINDAPLLRGADVAVAMGRGSALAQTSADLILVRDALDEIPRAVALARRAQRVVRQNLAWAIVYNLAALPLAAFGLVPPWVAAIGMAASSVGVVLNSMRLSRADDRGRDAGWSLRASAEAAP